MAISKIDRFEVYKEKTFNFLRQGNVVVHYWRFNSIKEIGHLSLTLTDGTHISFWPRHGIKSTLVSVQAKKFQNLADDIEGEGRVPDKYLCVPINPGIYRLDEYKIKQWWEIRKNNTRYDLVVDNCAITVVKALIEGGFQLSEFIEELLEAFKVNNQLVSKNEIKIINDYLSIWEQQNLNLNIKERKIALADVLLQIIGGYGLSIESEKSKLISKLDNVQNLTTENVAAVLSQMFKEHKLESKVLPRKAFKMIEKRLKQYNITTDDRMSNGTSSNLNIALNTNNFSRMDKLDSRRILDIRNVSFNKRIVICASNKCTKSYNIGGVIKSLKPICCDPCDVPDLGKCSAFIWSNAQATGTNIITKPINFSKNIINRASWFLPTEPFTLAPEMKPRCAKCNCEMEQHFQTNTANILIEREVEGTVNRPILAIQTINHVEKKIVVCKSEVCAKSYNVDGETKFFYPTCCNPCEFFETSPRRCAAFLWNNRVMDLFNNDEAICNSCKCKRRYHAYTNEETVLVGSESID